MFSSYRVPTSVPTPGPTPGPTSGPLSGEPLENNIQFGIIRNVLKVETSIKGIIVTSGNLPLILSKLGSKDSQRGFADTVLEFMDKSHCKSDWHHGVPCMMSFWLNPDIAFTADHKEGAFHFRFCLSYSIGHGWNIKRKLLCVAFSESALFRLASLRSHVENLGIPGLCVASSSQVYQMLKDLDSATRSQVLAAAIARIFLTSSPGSQTRAEFEQESSQMEKLIDMLPLVHSPQPRISPSKCFKHASTISTNAPGSKKLEEYAQLRPMVNVGEGSVVVFGAGRPNPTSTHMTYGLCNMILQDASEKYTKRDLQDDLRRALINDTVCFTVLGDSPSLGSEETFRLGRHDVSTRISRTHPEFRLASLLQAWHNSLLEADAPALTISGRQYLTSQRAAGNYLDKSRSIAFSSTTQRRCVSCGQKLDPCTGESLSNWTLPSNLFRFGGWDEYLEVCKNVLQCFSRVEDGSGFCLMPEMA